MTPAILSAIALAAAILLSVVSRINVGLVAIAFVGLLAAYVEGFGTPMVLGAFPTSLFLTLTGVTLLFAIAQQNGTLEKLALLVVGLARGNARFLPIIFFGIALVVSTVGPGAIAAVALIVPVAMAIGARAEVPHFLTALMVANGANAGNLSPISAVGVIANSSMARAGLVGHEGKVWFANLAAHALVALAAYLLLGGWRLRGRSGGEPAEPVSRLSRGEWITIVVILAWIAGVLLFGMNLGFGAFLAAVALIVLRTVDETLAIRGMPWSAILLVTGVSLLVGVLEATGGMDLMTALLSRLATPQTVNGVIAFVTGAISIFSSTSGVVMPAFLPTSTGLAEQLGGGDPLAIALSINVGSSIVDVSPLSTLGALCVAAVGDGAGATRLFRQLLAWGVAMAVVGAVICQLFMGPLARI
jgi:Na+/H+ antiporter NhaD/arsenite permease-like protein